MATGAQTWSTTAASNNSADGSVNWAEGMAPSAVNNSARAEMASFAMWREDNSGTLLTSGSTTAYTVSSKQVSTAVADGHTIAVNFHATNDSAATLNVDSIGAKQLQMVSGTNLSGGEYQAGTIHKFRYSSSSTAWVEISATNVSSNTVPNSSITYAKIQNETAGTILGNGSTAAAAPSEITIGTGLSLSATSLTAPAYPPTSAFKNLIIKTATTTTINGSADFVTLATSGSSSFITLPASGTINMASTGVANGLDTGALTNSTFYAIWAIAGTSTSTHADLLASTSFTTPLMPSGYAYKARIGAQVTTTTTATAALHGIYQFGRKARYVMNVAGTSGMPAAASGTAGNVSTPTFIAVDVSPFVPTTVAEAVHLTPFHSGGSLIVAPSTGFGGTGAAFGNRPPIIASGASDKFAWPTILTLETTNIYWANDTAAQAIVINGWEDNI